LTQGALSQATFAAESVLVILVTSPREHSADGLPDVLPGDLTSAHAMILAQREMLAAAQSEAKVRALEIERLKLQLARARRQTYGQSSERGKLLVEQLELAIAELEETRAEEEVRVAKEPRRRQRRRPGRVSEAYLDRWVGPADWDPTRISRCRSSRSDPKAALVRYWWRGAKCTSQALFQCSLNAPCDVVD
jgi:transposase